MRALKAPTCCLWSWVGIATHQGGASREECNDAEKETNVLQCLDLRMGWSLVSGQPAADLSCDATSPCRFPGSSVFPRLRANHHHRRIRGGEKERRHITAAAGKAGLALEQVAK